jgi:class 3 adenylate cyclase
MGRPDTTGVPEDIRYVKSDDLHIAYQTRGAGPPDLLIVRAWFSTLTHLDDQPETARIDQRLSALGRLILFDGRGTGLSDRLRTSRLPTLEERMRDVQAILDAVGSRRVVLVAMADGGPMTCLFAATLPERTLALVLMNTHPRIAWAPDYPWGMRPEELEEELDAIEQSWGTMARAEEVVRQAAPSRADDRAFIEWWRGRMQSAAGPGDAAALLRMFYESDVRDVLPAIRVPTLVLSRGGVMAEESAAMAVRIPGARHLVMPGVDRMVMASHTEEYLDEVERFVREVQDQEAVFDRVLATVLITDIVGSTRLAVEMGDRRWADLLEEHHRLIRAQLARFRGREIDTAGDGFLATFDGPARAIRCAETMIEAVRGIGLELRVGIHTGECEPVGDRLRGVAVHIAARVASLAEPGVILVSSTVKDLVAGSGLAFADFGTHELKGVPGAWTLYAVTNPGP